MSSNHLEAEKTAAEWLSRRDGTQWGSHDQAALDRWLEESPAHAVAFIRLEAAWRKADRYQALGAGLPKRQVPTPEQINRSPFFDEAAVAKSVLQSLIDEKQPSSASQRRWPMAAAATVLVLIGASIVSYFELFKDVYSAPVGGLVSVPVNDGSRITLNTDTKVRVRVNDKERMIRLERGEAFFEVAHDSARPFVVSAGTKRIVAVGTQFSVRCDGADVRVTVAEGKVRVEDAAHMGMGVTLVAGGIAKAGVEGDVQIQSRPLPDVQESLSWRQGFVSFHNANLAEAVAEFNRYSEKKIELKGTTLVGIQLSGKFRMTNVDAFVRLLQNGFPIHARDTGDVIVLTPRVP